MQQFTYFVFCAFVGLTYSLELRSVQEGSCRDIPVRQTIPAEDIDLEWVFLITNIICLIC